jgi:hypothetical protein
MEKEGIDGTGFDDGMGSGESTRRGWKREFGCLGRSWRSQGGVSADVGEEGRPDDEDARFAFHARKED